jgi:hypothetical protein
MEDNEEIAKTISEIQRFMKVTNDRILRLEEKVAKLVASSPNAQSLHGLKEIANESSSLGKSLGETRGKSLGGQMSITDYPHRHPQSE